MEGPTDTAISPHQQHAIEYRTLQKVVIEIVEIPSMLLHTFPRAVRTRYQSCRWKLIYLPEFPPAIFIVQAVQMTNASIIFFIEDPRISCKSCARNLSSELARRWYQSFVLFLDQLAIYFLSTLKAAAE
uniref:AlNc14C353G10933 protein n=1 Tax=Albugo laibachii Nc14 TaxID=890382 RepID=F0WXI2_9STRA|nr:AlNc14C353G10933 [Albugo laibachii Nc14]|eukprot:CCA26175.1 AlNc14C353G10933 [Albugo laibachii Nc14]